MEFRTFSWENDDTYRCDLTLKNTNHKLITLSRNDPTEYGISQIILHNLSKQELFDLKCVIEQELFEI